jgi:hypothetical protein
MIFLERLSRRLLLDNRLLCVPVSDYGAGFQKNCGIRTMWARLRLCLYA